MPARALIDTNIALYRIDEDEPEKQQIVSELFARSDIDLMVSTQVLIEAFNIATRKFGLSRRDAQTLVEELARLTVIAADAVLVRRAVATVVNHELSIWDAMIIEAAVDGGCSTLYTEDLNHGQVVRGVRIVNPFLPDPAAV